MQDAGREYQEMLLRLWSQHRAVTDIFWEGLNSGLNLGGGAVCILLGVAYLRR